MKKIKLLALASLLATCSASFAAPGNPEFVSKNLTVSANVLNVCTLQDATLSFGNYDASATVDKTANSSLNVMCSNNTAYSVTVEGADTEATSFMSGAGSDQLKFSLKKTVGDWNSTSGITGTGTGSSVSHSFSGVIPFGQTVEAGSYSRVLVMKVTY